MFSKEKMIWFSELKVVDLKAELKKRGFRGYSKMKKAELLTILVGIVHAERKAEIEARHEKDLAEIRAKRDESNAKEDELFAEIEKKCR